MDLINSIISIVITGYITISVLFTTLFLVGFIRNFRKEVTKIKEDKLPNLATVKLVSIEVVAGQMMMFDAMNDSFICQATTEEELWKTAKNLFPSKELLLK